MMIQIPKETKNKVAFEELANMILEEVEKGGAEIRELDFNHAFTGKNLYRKKKQEYIKS